MSSHLFLISAIPTFVMKKTAYDKKHKDLQR